MDAASEIERRLHIVGASGIEDKLQDGVPDCIQSLREAGVKVIVLTGDKKETAIEIGYATRLLVPSMELTTFDDGMTDIMVREAVSAEFLRLVDDGSLPDFSGASLGVKEWNLGLKIRNFVRAKVCKKTRVKSEREQKRETREFADGVAEAMLPPPSATSSVVGDDDDDDDDGGDYGVDESDGERLRDEGPPPPPSKVRKVFRRASSAKLIASAIRASQLSESAPSSRSLPASARSTALERLFSVDKAARHGRLTRHAEAVGAKPKKLRIKKGLKKMQQSLRGAAAAEDDANKPDPQVLQLDIDIDEINSSADQDSEDIFTDPTGATPIDGPKLSGVIITGQALSQILGNRYLESMLLHIFLCQDTVICCRASPKQKTLVVRLAKTYVTPRPVTLAIGDGANDVGMIQEAQVGVGISGLEGQQAVNAADFSIAQFRFLKELMLVHGRWNFVRMAKVCMYSFYKNAVLIFTMFYFQIYSHWSGRSQYEDYVTSMFNFFLAIPILLAGIFDRDITKTYARSHPETYATGRTNEDLSRRVIFRWSSLSIAHASILYFMMQWIYSDGTSGFAARTLPYSNLFANGSGGDLPTYGTSMFVIIVYTLTAKALLETKSWLVGQRTGKLWDRFPYTIAGFVIAVVALMAIAFFVYEQAFFATWGQVQGFFFLVPSHVFVYRPWFYLQLFTVLVAAIFLDVFVKLLGYFYFPSQTMIHQEISEMERRDAVKRGLILKGRTASVGQGGEEGTQFWCGCVDLVLCCRTLLRLDKEDRKAEGEEGGEGGEEVGHTVSLTPEEASDAAQGGTRLRAGCGALEIAGKGDNEDAFDGGRTSGSSSSDGGGNGTSPGELLV